MKSLLTLIICVIIGQAAHTQAYPDRHNTSRTAAWESCDTDQSPNAKRDPGHWIMYDLGDQYGLQDSRFWNNNTPNETSKGISEYVIDYSINGEDWVELGIFSLAEGPGSTIYSGEQGPSFGGVNARYVLISALSNHGDECYSLGEIRIDAAITTTTSIADNELDVNVSMNPNPAMDVTRIIVDNLPQGEVSYQITDINGKLVAKGSIANTKTDVDISNFSTGAYTVTIYNGEGLKSEILNVVSANN